MNLLPTGTVTFLFTDIEGSTRLWQSHPEQMACALARHDELLHRTIDAHHGYIFKTIGDAVCAVFDRVGDAILAMLAAQHALHTAEWPAETPIRVRMGVHTGAAEEKNGDYLGPTVNFAARLMSAAHGGQLLVSQAAHALVGDTLPGEATLRDLGLVRLKDLPGPVRVYQLAQARLPSSFPPLRGLESTPNNLPHPVTSFVGREKEIADLCSMLGRQRLVTLVGPGGAGKSRLALETSRGLLGDFPDGIWLVEMAALPDIGLLPQALASVLCIAETPSCPIERALAEHLRERTLLFVLDNAERLPAPAVRLISELLKASPGLKILATSRDRLGLTGEQLYDLPPLHLPDLDRLPPVDDLAQYASIRLFVERARLVAPGFTLTSENAALVASLCHRLDGMPLPIELAAAQAYSMRVESIVETLHDRFRLLSHSTVDVSQNRALGALIDWSYDRLSEEERAVLRRLAVFAGGCTLDAAQSVCADDCVAADSVALRLQSLLEKCLVSVSDKEICPRYRMLDSVREYALDRLQQAGEEDRARSLHRDYYLALAEQAVPQLNAPNADEWLARLDAEEDNLRAALLWNAADPRGMAARLRLAGALWVFWRMRGHISEGQRWLAQAVTFADNARDHHAGVLGWARGHLGVPAETGITKELLEDCQAKLREIGSQPVFSNIWNTVAQTVRHSPAAQAVIDRLDSSAEQLRRLGMPPATDSLPESAPELSTEPLSDAPAG